MLYTKERKNENEKRYAEICALTKKINDMAKAAVIDTLKECEDQSIIFGDDDGVWGTDCDGCAVKATSIALDNEGNVCYHGYDEEGTDMDGVIELDDIVSFNWSDVLFAVNCAFEEE